MRDIETLVNRVDAAFLKNVAQRFSNASSQQLKQVNQAVTYMDLQTINGEENTKQRFHQLAISKYDDIALERIIGKNHLMDISFFSRGLEVAKTVCRLIVFEGQNKLPVGTGFLVGGGLLMTNNHVIRSKPFANRLVAEFEYEKDHTGLLKTSYFFTLNPDAFFITNKKLDYTVVAVDPISSNDPDKKLSTYGCNKLALSSNRILQGEAVSIIQHPKGLPKMIAIRENRVVEIKESFIHYTTDTQQGSSGSLVANDKWEIIALHSSGVPETDEKGNIKLTKKGFYTGPADEPFINWVANQGVLMDAILRDIAAKKVKAHQIEKKKILLEKYQVEVSEEEYRLPSR